MDVSFCNSNEEEDARSSLSQTNQSSRPFGAYPSECQRLQNLSGIADHKTLISYMQDGIAPDLKKCISQQRVINKRYSFDDFVALCKECVVQLDWERPASTKRTPNPDLRGNYPTPV
uniref:Bgt-20952 n=1 Tax=Blumeria graminis f. sp. tritici 96224 TaxID=1268274 RepID=A0A381LBE2_BLUGR